LVERYTAELGEYEKLGKVVQALTESTAQSPYNSETFAKLESNEHLWETLERAA
jgi:hypothetical protein